MMHVVVACMVPPSEMTKWVNLLPVESIIPRVLPARPAPPTTYKAMTSKCPNLPTVNTWNLPATPNYENLKCASKTYLAFGIARPDTFQAVTLGMEQPVSTSCVRSSMWSTRPMIRWRRPPPLMAVLIQSRAPRRPRPGWRLNFWVFLPWKDCGHAESPDPFLRALLGLGHFCI
jgi:hypothetical protein